MEFNEIIDKALEIRKRYHEFEISTYGREWTHEEIMLGLVKDIGDLAELVQVKEGVRKGEDIDNKLAHELSDCMWSIIILAKQYNIDLEKAFLKTMDEISERLG